jgi:hypothetical protein
MSYESRTPFVHSIHVLSRAVINRASLSATFINSSDPPFPAPRADASRMLGRPNEKLHAIS